MMRLWTWWQKRHAKKTTLLHIITRLKSKFILNMLLVFMWAITNTKIFSMTKVFKLQRYMGLKGIKMRPCQQNIHRLKHYLKCILSPCCCLVMNLNITIT
jgi:hypothetical protein